MASNGGCFTPADRRTLAREPAAPERRAARPPRNGRGRGGVRCDLRALRPGSLPLLPGDSRRSDRRAGRAPEHDDEDPSRASGRAAHDQPSALALPRRAKRVADPHPRSRAERRADRRTLAGRSRGRHQRRTSGGRENPGRRSGVAAGDPALGAGPPRDERPQPRGGLGGSPALSASVAAGDLRGPDRAPGPEGGESHGL